MKLKKGIYYTLGIFLGVLLSFIVHGSIEILYINHYLGEEFIPEQGITGHSCYLPFYLQIILPFLGVVSGYLIGQIWFKRYLRKREKAF